MTPEVLRRIRALGGKILDQVPRYRSIRARLTPEAAVALAELDAVQTIRPADEARTRQATTAGSAFRAAASKANTSEGDRAHRADSARSTHGVDGTGIGIGVISNGVRTLADRQASGDLPGRVTVLPGQAGSGDEGTAILEIVHDLAPGAELYFATGSGGQARFASNIEALCDAGVSVILDDIGYAGEAVFQDDLIAQGVNAAVADGCYYFSSAGNNGNLNDGTSGVWEGDYDAGTALMLDGENVGIRHEFESGTEENTLAPGSFGFGGIWSDVIVLQWADPWGASANDYDLFLIDADGNVVGSSTNTQDGSQDPIEVIDVLIFSYDDVRLVVVKASGSDRYLRLQVFGGQLEIATAGNTFGHSAAEKCVWDRSGRRAHGRRNRRRLQRHRVGTHRQFRRAAPRFFRNRRHRDYGGKLQLDRREAAQQTGSRCRWLCDDGDARFFDVLRHVRRGAARSGNCSAGA